VFTGEPRLRRPTGLASSYLDEAWPAIAEARLREHVTALAEPRNRVTAAEGMHRAEAYVSQLLRDSGWRVQRQPFAFTNVAGVPDFRVEGDPHPRVVFDHIAGANVLATRSGLSSGPPVVVCAHLDTVTDSPGADDNGSGVAVLLALAELLAPVTPERDIVLGFLDMEEIGCFGARALAAELRWRSLTGCIVLESVGYVDRAPGSQSMPPLIGMVYPAQIRRIRRRGRRGDWTLVVYRASSAQLARAWAQPLAQLEGRDAVVLTRDPVDLPVVGAALRRRDSWAGEFARGDHAEFWAVGLPAIQVTDTANFRNPHYHQPSDTPDTLDYRRVRAVAAATAAAVVDLAGLRSPRSTTSRR